MKNFRDLLIFIVALGAGTTFGAATCPYLPGREQRMANEIKTRDELLENARKEIAELKHQLKQ